MIYRFSDDTRCLILSTGSLGCLGFVISFPDGRLLRTNEVEAFIQGPVDVFVGCGRPLLSCFSRVIFMTGGIVNLHHGGTIYFLDRSMIEVPYSCEIAVPVGAIIEFALNLPAEE